MNVPRSWWDLEVANGDSTPQTSITTPHFDYNPWQQWNTPWQHLYPGD